MFKKKLLGLYCAGETVEYLSMTESLFGRYALVSPSSEYAPFDRLRGNVFDQLRLFLEQLPPDSGREIYLALPRFLLFIREMTLPAMPLEDAIASIENSLVIHSHLPPSEIYYDVLVLNGGDEQFSALLFYAPKKEIDAYLTLFDELGHSREIRAIFPLGYGISLLTKVAHPSWKTKQGCLRLEQGAIAEFLVVKDGQLQCSLTSPKDLENENEMILTVLVERFPDLDPTAMNALALFDDFSSDHSVVKRLPSLSLNRASAALAPVLLGAQKISLDETPVKVNIFHPLKFILPILCLIIGGLYFMTMEKQKTLEEMVASLHQVETQVNALELKLEPLETQIEKMAKASKFKEDVEQFMLSRPELYTALNEIASLIPEGTWFSSLTFTDNEITLRGRGEDALKVIELLRSSSLFNEVKLKGSVNRRKAGDEHFTVTLGVLSSIPADPPDVSEEEGVVK